MAQDDQKKVIVLNKPNRVFWRIGFCIGLLWFWLWCAIPFLISAANKNVFYWIGLIGLMLIHFGVFALVQCFFYDVLLKKEQLIIGGYFSTVCQVPISKIKLISVRRMFNVQIATIRFRDMRKQTVIRFIPDKNVFGNKEDILKKLSNLALEL